VPQVLELAHLVEQDSVAQMQIGSGRIETGFDTQHSTCPQFGRKFFFDQQFIAAARRRMKRIFGRPKATAELIIG
jgi:hypothetical protein